MQDTDLNKFNKPVFINLIWCIWCIITNKSIIIFILCIYFSNASHIEAKEKFNIDIVPGDIVCLYDLLYKSEKEDSEQRLLEAVCVQHEIDHLNGISCIDKEVKLKPIVSKKSFGRNEMVEITDGKILSTMKYKKAKPLIDSGLWTIYIGGPIT